jgi:RNA polymerase sigma-70 factor (ECF subfamily)
MSHPTDEELIEQTRAGTDRAFAELVSRHQRRVAATIRSVIGPVSQEDLADVAQDIFLLVFRALGSFRGESQFSTYLTQIALRHCYREAKRRRKRSSTFFSLFSSSEDRTPPEERIAGDARSDRPMLAEERHDAVGEALGRLPEEFRTVLVLRIIEEMPVEQVAEALEVSTGTVKSRLYRAKEKMRELLDGYDLDFEQEL